MIHTVNVLVNCSMQCACGYLLCTEYYQLNVLQDQDASLGAIIGNGHF